MKIVVFDLDETLGYFSELGIFWDSLLNYFKYKNNEELTQDDFNNILDIFPEFVRPNIINILNYLKTKKQSTCCHKMMIYTNNNGPREWSHKIISYFESKINFKLVDQIISAFKINGELVEVCRTTHSKTHEDFIRCTKIAKNAQICFLDDTFYPEMANDNIYYIHVKPYYHDLKFDEMITRIQNSDMYNNRIDKADFSEYMMNYIKKYNYNPVEKKPEEYEIDKIVGKEIINHLQEFFQKTKKNKSRKHKSHKHHNVFKKNKTCKR